MYKTTLRLTDIKYKKKNREINTNNYVIVTEMKKKK